ncbi:AAA family ATPase [Rhizobium leguminosarum]|nr:AAA family ATPase [Rhizobium leguminosarum]
MANEVLSSAPREAYPTAVGMLDRPPGTICTFYSYKGGVGRSMTLANVAFLLSKYGKKVLIIDWDLEAPGLERYFAQYLIGSRQKTAGIVDLFDARRRGEATDWRQSLISAPIDGGERISILHAGRDDGDYLERLRGINWLEEWVGGYLEQLRFEWQSDFDFVLIDSRTGITDIGGICAIHLPDYLISMFTTTEQSLLGVKETMLRARNAHARLPLDRKKLLIIPLPSRDESNTEYQLAVEWRRKFANELATFFEDWIPADEEPERVLDILKIPYVAYWSFGEQLPVAKEDATNTKTLAYSYALVARLLNGKLSWKELREGRQTTIEEMEQKAKVELLAAEAARVREEAMSLQQMREQERLQEELLAQTIEQERKTELTDLRVSKLHAEIHARGALYRTNLFLSSSIFAFSLLMFAIAVFGPRELILNYVNSSSELLNLTALSVGTLMASFLYIYWSYTAVQVASNVRRDLDRLDYAYRTSSGDFRDVPAEGAPALFVDRAETLAARLYEGKFRRKNNSDHRAPEASATSRTPQNPSGSSVVAATPTTIESIPPAEYAGSTWRSGEQLDVFISYASEGVATLWLREFSPIFTAWLTEALGRVPSIYLGALGTDDKTNLAQFEAISRASLLICIAAPHYRRSGKSRELKNTFLEGHKSFQIIDISLSGDAESSSERGGTEIDFSDLAFVGEAFSRSERYIEFQQRVRSVAERAAYLLESDSKRAQYTS